MYCFSSSFCFICLKHYSKENLFDINKNKIKDVQITEVLQSCGIDANYCGDTYQVYICGKCIKRVELFYAFKQDCSNNLVKLKGYIHQMKYKANIAFHADLKVVLSDPTYNTDANETRDYVDVSQFVETEIKTDEMEVESLSPSKEFAKLVTPIIVPVQNKIANNLQDLHQISNFVYDNHFMNVSLSNFDSFNEVIEVASSPESINSNNSDSQNSNASIDDVPKVLNSSHPCKICYKSHINSTQLSLHTFLHTLITYPNNEASKFMKYYCVLCTLDITELSNIKKHLLDHTLDKLYTCEKCEQQFISYIDYKKHLSLNQTHKPFICELCNLGFFTDLKLKNHVKKKHLKSCVYCDECFSSEYRLKMHVTKKHVISCVICKKRFKNKVTLDSHMLEKHNNRFCNFCCTSFNSNDSLKQHLFDNHFDLQSVGQSGHQYNCSKCKTEFQTKYSLNEHLAECLVQKPTSKKK